MLTAPRWRWVLCVVLFLRPPIQPTQAEQLFCTLHSCSACVGWIGGCRRSQYSRHHRKNFNVFIKTQYHYYHYVQHYYIPWQYKEDCKPQISWF